MGCLVYLIAIGFLFAGEPGYAALIVVLAFIIGFLKGPN